MFLFGSVFENVRQIHKLHAMFSASKAFANLHSVRSVEHCRKVFMYAQHFCKFVAHHILITNYFFVIKKYAKIYFPL